jgi:rubrerythrin
MPGSIQFPAIEISNTFNVVHYAADSATTAGWKNGFFKSLVYFDSAGKLWITTAIAERVITLLDRLLNSRIKATLTFRQFPGDAMTEARQRLCALLDNDPDDLYDQFIEHGDFKKLINNAATPAELIKLVESMGANSPDAYENSICSQCEHDLRGCSSAKCPECGAPTRRSNKAAA